MSLLCVATRFSSREWMFIKTKVKNKTPSKRKKYLQKTVIFWCISVTQNCEGRLVFSLADLFQTQDPKLSPEIQLKSLLCSGAPCSEALVSGARLAGMGTGGRGGWGNNTVLCRHATPEIPTGSRARRLLYRRTGKLCLWERRQEPIKHLYRSQNRVGDHKQYLSAFSRADEKMFSVECPDAVSRFFKQRCRHTDTRRQRQQTSQVKHL